MHLDVQDLKNFYYHTGLGRVAQKAIRDQTRLIWPDTSGLTVLGFGFAAPLLRPFLPDSRRVMALMPGPQGVMHWPMGQKNISVLCEETSWPIPTGHVDRMILMHGLETCENPSTLLDECHRVLGPGGKALFIVPNRAGLWSRRDATPFGYGRPYSLSQLEAQLKKHRFKPDLHRAVLFSPPSHKRFWQKSAPTIEKIGLKISSHIAGGVLMVEATKQVYAPKPKGLKVELPSPLRALDGRPAPIAGSSRLASNFCRD